MRNADYWKERMRILEEARNASNGKLAARLEREFDGAMREIEDKISGWYRRLAKNNEVALSEAKRLLKAGELKEFRWTVEEYIRHGDENGLRRNWAKELENASARVHINRLDALKIDLRGVIERLGGSQEKQTKAHLADQYADTVYRTMFEIQKGVGVYWDTAKVSEKQIETVLSKPWTADRRTFSDRIWLDKDGLLDEVYKQLARNVMLGRGPDASIKAIAKRFDASKYNAGRLVMTESAYVSAEADGHVYQELGVERFEVDAALDGTTCGVCGDMDGRHFPRSEYQPGLNAPPFHPNCRCTTVPYIDDDIQRELDAKAGRAARNPETAKTEIVDDMTYADWKAKYVDAPKIKAYNKVKELAQAQIHADYAIKLNKGQQDKHIPGTNNYEEGRSILTADPLELIRLYAGKGHFFQKRNGEWNGRTWFEHSGVIGIYKTPNGVSVETTKGVMHYSKKNGIHIVPSKPEGEWK